LVVNGLRFCVFIIVIGQAKFRVKHSYGGFFIATRSISKIK